jgi:hypothetical protein
MKKIGVFLHQLHRLQLFEHGLLGYLILRLPALFFKVAGIGYIADIPDLIAKMEQVTINEIEGDRRTGMPQMAFAADGRTAHIHAHMTGCDRSENLFLTGIRIVDL